MSLLLHASNGCVLSFLVCVAVSPNDLVDDPSLMRLDGLDLDIGIRQLGREELGEELVDERKVPEQHNNENSTNGTLQRHPQIELSI